ncbi:FKBP-type peptidyl-prolyl cis-trans isomerase [Bacteroides sp. ET489]|uniref:FKBP-type peptidyl-prolyl cis-trans isomerase n=1 Tax=Bacteroides sp. ET489 TaxID=3057126 RepID=UPI0026720409|nr:FKBP-type peptidyl-prolyl cis-trans isomerase [Bacteroides sp. ET489]MDO3389463.1 FKBP-type peptidyl-prolyl cis-trans isomerase [Bacteroides sp. ET489]
MNKCLLYLSLFLFLSVGFAACDEVEEVGEYDNWEPRNTAFIDSIHALAADRLLPLNAAQEEADKFEPGEMFGLETTASTTAGKQYVYCKKIVKNTAGAVPVYTNTVETHYYGTLITGDTFGGTFEGYAATDCGVLDPETKAPTAFDSPTAYSVSGAYWGTGWVSALQYMHVGERWMLYIPYQSGYGTGTSSLLENSAFTYDLQLESIE